MIISTRHALIFMLASLLLALAIALLPWGQVERGWQAYQRTYFARENTAGEIAVRQIIPRLGVDGQPAPETNPELCLTCHIGLEEISPSHPVETFGCVICHGGLGLALDKDQAHIGLRPNPADLTVAEQSCGQSGCHAGHADSSRNHLEQVTRSLQATYAGSIALVRYTFGAQKDLTPHFGVIGAVDPQPLPQTAPALAAFVLTPDSLPAEVQFAQNCLEGGCHVTEAATPQPYRYRATGCAACHVLYNDEGLYTGSDPTLPRDEPGHPALHQLTTAIPFTQCNHCHNRGNYSLRGMTFTPRPDLPPVGAAIPATMPPEGRRLREYYQPIGQFTLCEWELDCIDCHTQAEAMGDGHLWPDQKTMQYVQCRTCHGTLNEPPATARITDPDDPALRLARLNGHYSLEVGAEVIVTERGEKLGSVQQRGGQLVQFGKVDGREYTVPLVQGSQCQQQPDQQESRYCHQCHAYER
ncbi:MAG: hypothetical protein HC875_16715 [Anaerolineales bacterium]|nr:hypothetical protein [Anaerolineales bacterium]